MSEDSELIERVGVCLHKNWLSDDKPFSAMGAEYRTEFLRVAQTIVDAVRAYDAERRSSVLDVDALKTFDPQTPGTLVWLPNGMPPLSVSVHDPDDYRDPFALVTKMDRAPGIKT